MADNLYGESEEMQRPEHYSTRSKSTVVVVGACDKLHNSFYSFT